jgi:hypothetical protein
MGKRIENGAMSVEMEFSRQDLAEMPVQRFTQSAAH